MKTPEKFASEYALAMKMLNERRAEVSRDIEIAKVNWNAEAEKVFADRMGTTFKEAWSGREFFVEKISIAPFYGEGIAVKAWGHRKLKDGKPGKQTASGVIATFKVEEGEEG